MNQIITVSVEKGETGYSSNVVVQGEYDEVIAAFVCLIKGFEQDNPQLLKDALGRILSFDTKLIDLSGAEGGLS